MFGFSFLAYCLLRISIHPSKAQLKQNIFKKDKRLASCCLNNLFYVYFSYSLWQVVCTPGLHHSLEKYYPILCYSALIVKSQLEVQRSIASICFLREPRFSFEQKSLPFTEMHEEMCQCCD